ncbi:MAG: helix-turn-helix transcriptional regulator, partial [Acidobacteria bacterium]|nr:helix-turn-helix transcriptional regulator [Acidobacteriota bacterium]
IHPVHLARTFRRSYGYTIAEYVRRLRVDFACSALASSNESLAEIAVNAGFSDQSRFSKTFKRLTNLTPAEYRAAIHSR